MASLTHNEGNSEWLRFVFEINLLCVVLSFTKTQLKTVCNCP